MSNLQNTQIIPAKKKSKPAKYVPNDGIDRMITRIYTERLEKRTHALPHLRQYAKQIGWPGWAVRKRARQLGLARTKESTWSEKEIRILERWAYLSDERIRLKLKASGFIRTTTAVHLKLKRMRIRQCSGFYTARGLAELMGVDSHCVARWIGLGYLKAERRGTERVEAQHGDIWCIKEKDVREFVLSHPLEFAIRKVADQLWFLDLVTDGKVCAR